MLNLERTMDSCCVLEPQHFYTSTRFLFPASPPSLAWTLTFAVPLWILNADILAHISDDWGVFHPGQWWCHVLFSPHWGRGCGYTDDTLLLRLLHVCASSCACVCLCEHPFLQSPKIFSFFPFLLPGFKMWHRRGLRVHRPDWIFRLSMSSKVHLKIGYVSCIGRRLQPPLRINIILQMC